MKTTNQGTTGNVIKTAANACVQSCQKLAAQMEQAKGNLLAELQETAVAPERLVRLALHEAEALAWRTGYPHLLFPALAAEKIQAVARWNARQLILRRKNSVHALSI